MNRLLEAIVVACVAAIPLVFAAIVAVVLQWLRVRRARLRAERLALPPSTEPPQPLEPWYSLRPRRQRKKQKQIRKDE